MTAKAYCMPWSHLSLSPTLSLSSFSFSASHDYHPLSRKLYPFHYHLSCIAPSPTWSLSHLLGFKSQFSLTSFSLFFIDGGFFDKGFKIEDCIFSFWVWFFMLRQRTMGRRWNNFGVYTPTWVVVVVYSVIFVIFLTVKRFIHFLGKACYIIFFNPLCVYPWKLTIIIQIYDLLVSQEK